MMMMRMIMNNLIKTVLGAAVFAILLGLLPISFPAYIMLCFAVGGLYGYVGSRTGWFE